MYFSPSWWAIQHHRDVHCFGISDFGGMILLGGFIVPTSQNPFWISSLKLAFCTPANQLLEDEIS